MKNVWMTRAEILEALGISLATLKRHVKAGKIKTRPYAGDGDGRKNLEYLKEDLEVEEKDYFYNPETERYVFHLRCLAGSQFVVPKYIIEEIVSAYSNFGSKATVNQVARSHGWSRAQVKEVLKLLGKTHDSLPYTDEVIAEEEEEDLVEDLVRLKEQKIFSASEKKIWTITKKKAEKWDALHLQILEPLKHMLQSDEKPPLRALKPSRKHRPFSAFIMPSDLHVGKKGWALECGTHYDINTCRARLMSALDDLAGKIERHGVPEKIITGTGSDFFHVDNYAGGTTRGTPQDTDGSVAKIMHEGWHIWREFIDGLRQLAPVEMFNMAGNHDNVLTFALLQICQAHWRNSEDVTVHVSPHPRSYTMVGNTLVGISHSEDTKHKDLPNLMAKEARELWGKAKHEVWFTGHWHAERTMDEKGTLIHVVPSLAGTDRWHVRNGYVLTNKILPAYIIDHERGESDQLNGFPSI